MRKSGIRMALEDLRDGVSSTHVWPMLGWQEVRQRYRRSVLGPFWLTISTAIMVLAMGPLYGKLFNQDISSYFLYLALGLVAWQLVAQTINESCTAFIGAENFIKQVRMPLSVYVLRIVWRNFIVFFHNMVFVAAVLLYYQPGTLWPALLWLPVSLLAIFLNGLWFGVTIGLICARFRDIPQIVGNVVQVAFFLTPVLWQSHMLGRHAWVNDLNPFFHFVEIVRAPLMGLPVPLATWGAVTGITAAGSIVMILLFARYRARIAFWI